MALLCLAPLLVLPAGAGESERPGASDAAAGMPAETTAEHTAPPGRAGGLDALFADLGGARSVDQARMAELSIREAWLRSGSETADLLTDWAGEAVAERNFDLALTYLDAATVLAPHHAETWNRRASLHYLRRDRLLALADLRRALVLEPRHFAALGGLGLVLRELGEKTVALQAFRAALDIHPHLDAVRRAADDLALEVEGREI